MKETCSVEVKCMRLADNVTLHSNMSTAAVFLDIEISLVVLCFLFPAVCNEETLGRRGRNGSVNGLAP
jgi:hypothetical protein